MVDLDPDLAISEGSPALAVLIMALGGAAMSRALVGRVLLTRLIRRDPPEL